MAATPGRKTVLQLDIGEVTLAQQGWSLQRDAQHIKPQKQAGDNITSGVFSTGGDAWLMRPQFSETASALKSTVGGYVEEAEVELAPGYVSYNGFRRRDDLTNVGSGASVIVAGAPTFIKRVASTDDWDVARLTADATALPPPPADADALIPQDRVLSGYVTYPANTAFGLMVRTPEGWGGQDSYFSFYFGGETTTFPDGTSGGHYCLVLRGGGDAELWEYDEVAGDWGTAPREKFRWNLPGASPGGLTNVFSVVPYARNRIWIAGQFATPYSTGGFTLAGLLFTVMAGALKAQAGAGTTTLLRETLAEAGHRHEVYATGPGTIRADVRRDLRIPFSILKGVYFENGILVDSPFEINRNYPADTPLTVKASWYRYDNTNITIDLYNAADDTPLSTDSDGNFLTVAGQRKYYAVFTFSSSDTYGTPALFSYQIDAPASYIEVPRIPLITKRLHDVRIIGPDLEPTQEGADVRVVDEIDEAHIIREVDGLRTLISILNPADDTTISHLFEGETSQPTAIRRGFHGDTYPVPTWHDYNVRLTGLYPRLEEQFHDQKPFSFANSSEVPAGYPVGATLASTITDSGFEPWRVTDVVRWLLNRAGVRNDELDIPSIEFRLWADEHGQGDNLAIQPGTTYGTMAASLVKDLLGWVLMRDPNAGLRGMWRVLQPPPSTSVNVLWRFWLDAPPNPGRIVEFPDAYSVDSLGTSFILQGTWQPSPQRPRGTIVTVTGVATDGSGQFDVVLPNPAARAYLQREVPIYRGPDPFLSTPEACMWVARRIDQVACQPRSWFDFVAPLVLVTDLADPYQTQPRPLRINDLIYIRSEGVDVKCILRSVNPGWQGSDEFQFAHYEGMVFPTL